MQNLHKIEISQKIYLIRSHRVMVDSDLAALYGVETGALNRAVRRNRDRFPSDFMFELTSSERENLRCQIGTSSSEHHGGRRYDAQFKVVFDAIRNLVSPVLPPNRRKIGFHD